MPTPSRAIIFRRAFVTLVVSALGGLIANYIGLPAAYLTGGAIAVSLSALFGMKALIFTPMRNVAFVVIGMSMGATVPQNALDLVEKWPISVAALMLSLVIIIAVTTITLSKFFGLDRLTAFLASCPGHLSLVIGISESSPSNSRKIAVIQSIRVLVLTVAVPISAKLFAIDGATPLDSPPDMSLTTLAALVTICTISGFALHFLKVPAAFVLGPMAITTAAKLAGFLTGAVPAPLIFFGFVSMGALIGTRFVGVSSQELRQSALGGLTVSILAIGITIFLAIFVAPMAHMPLGQVWIGLAPGGLETMGALGIAFGYDTAFIAAHHALRLLVLGFAIPIVSILIKRQ